MGVERKAVVYCDAEPECPVWQQLNSLDQPYQEAQERGWTVGEDGMSMYCPKHKKGPEHPAPINGLCQCSIEDRTKQGTLEAHYAQVHGGPVTGARY